MNIVSSIYTFSKTVWVDRTFKPYWKLSLWVESDRLDGRQHPGHLWPSRLLLGAAEVLLGLLENCNRILAIPVAVDHVLSPVTKVKLIEEKKLCNITRMRQENVWEGGYCGRIKVSLSARVMPCAILRHDLIPDINHFLSNTTTHVYPLWSPHWKEHPILSTTAPMSYTPPPPRFAHFVAHTAKGRVAKNCCR